MLLRKNHENNILLNVKPENQILNLLKTRSRPTSLDTPPPLPERPPPKMKKSILKSSKSYDVSRSVSSELDDPQILLKNTKANEMFAYRKSLQQAAARASPVSLFRLLVPVVRDHLALQYCITHSFHAGFISSRTHKRLRGKFC